MNLLALVIAALSGWNQITTQFADIVKKFKKAVDNDPKLKIRLLQAITAVQDVCTHINTKHPHLLTELKDMAPDEETKEAIDDLGEKANAEIKNFLGI